MNVEQGLRHFLTNAGFRLPGEAQKIDRLITVFAQCFWEDNAGTASCPFSHQDTVFILSFSVIMLNTDLHKANANLAKKKVKKMTKQEFMNNLRGVDNSSDLSKDYLSKIYDSIASQVIEMEFDPKSRQDEQGTEGGGDSSRVSYKGLSKGVKSAGELLRGMALFDHHYSLVGIDCMISNELISSTVEACFHHFHGIIAAILDASEFDLQSVLATLDILKNSLCTSVFLDMKIERQAFATQLARVKYIKDEQEGGQTDGMDAGFYIVSGEHKKEEWFVEMERACETGEGIETTIGNIHLLIVDLRASMHDSRKRKELKTICSRIQGGDELLDDANREFILEGDLLKRCRSGKKVKYRFFLFSDRLVYTHLSIKGYYKIHQQLILSLMRVVDEKKSTFQIMHPRKSFLVICPSVEKKRAWMEAILTEIDKLEEKKNRAEEIRHAYSDVSGLVDMSAEGASSNRGSEGGVEWTDLRNGVVVDINGLGSVGGDGNTSGGRGSVKSATDVHNRDSGVGSSGGGEDVKVLNERYYKAVHYSTDLLSDKNAGEDVKLSLYGLFKQAKQGDASGGAGERGGVLGEVEQLKLDSWKSCGGMSKLEAKKRYIELLGEVSPNWEEGVDVKGGNS